MAAKAPPSTFPSPSPCATDEQAPPAPSPADPPRWRRSNSAVRRRFPSRLGRPALAFYVVDVIYTSNDGSAQANQLVAPSGPTASADDTSGTITVGWTAAAQASGVVPQYQVVRVSGPGSPTTVCTVPSEVTSCQDTGLTAGTTYDYSIRALLDDWQSAPVTVTATTASPTLAIALSTSTAAAGTPIDVQTVTAEVGGVPDPTYTGNKTITWSGLADSPSGVAPSYPSRSVTFTNGVATLTGSTFTDDQAGSDTLTATRRRCDQGDRLGRCHGQPARGGVVGGGHPVVAQRRWCVRRDDHRPRRLRQRRHRLHRRPGGHLRRPVERSGRDGADLPGDGGLHRGGGHGADHPLRRAEHRPHRHPGHPHRQLGDVHGQRGSGCLLRAWPPRRRPAPVVRSTRRSPPSTPTATPPPATPASRRSPSGGPSNAPDRTAPTYPATVAFTAGVGTAPITLFDAQSTDLTATQGTLTGSSGSFTVGGGAAGQLAFLTEPASSSSGTVWGVQPTVAVQDAYGNTVSSSSAPVELAIGAHPAGASATLTCSTDPEEASGGVAGFTQCEITTTISGDYTLIATSAGLVYRHERRIEVSS